jgi:selenium metabolism protein YedF
MYRPWRAEEMCIVKTIDARGLPCPQPVVLTRKALQEDSAITTIVDSDTSQHNVTRMAEQAGASVQADVRSDGIYLHIMDGQTPEIEESVCESPPIPGLQVLSVPSEFMGRGEHDELGHILMRGFFHTLGEIRPLPDKIIFFNSAVKLVVKGSPIVDDLTMLVDRGVEVLACGTCLSYYGLKEKLAVGEISNMYTIAETMLAAGSLITI